jgi:hypothetical protein
MRRLILCLIGCFGAYMVSCQEKPSTIQQKRLNLSISEYQVNDSGVIQRRRNSIKQNQYYKNDKHTQESYSTEKLNLVLDQDQVSKSLQYPSDMKLARVIDDPTESEPVFKKRRQVMGPTMFDSRIEIRALDLKFPGRDSVMHNAESVGIIVERNQLHLVADSFYQIDVGRTLKDMYNLCPGEPYLNQPVAGIGTAFIIGDQQMLTAAHVFNGPMAQYAVVFGFEMVNEKGVYDPLIPITDVFFIQQQILLEAQLDLSIFSLDRPLNRAALVWANSSTMTEGSSVYMIGHPSGLPKKGAFNASMLQNKHPWYFFTTLDAFQGNSGSPVFSVTDHTLIGVLVSGEMDYISNGHCNISAICKIPYCQGEKVIRIETIQDYLK